jgi:hypothetical protein
VNTVVLAVIASGLAAVLTLGLLVVVAAAGVRAWSRWRGGLAADGVVVPGGPGGGDDGQGAVVAEFRTRDGEVHRVRIPVRRPLDPGTVVTVRYPAGSPEQAVLDPSPR